VLGCTHYPLLRDAFEQAVRPGVTVIDSAESTAVAAVKLFASRLAGRVEQNANANPMETEVHCFATDSVEKFERLGSRFLGRPVGNVTLVDLGG
jgi:glutamate racemase